MLNDMFTLYSDLLKQLVINETLWEKTSVLDLPSHQKSKRADYNATSCKFDNTLMHSMFHNMAKVQPEVAAVFFDDTCLNYGDLFSQSNQLGRRLIHLGARRNQLIAVVMERGWEQVVATVSILNAGAAYLPIDPNWPIERIAHLLDIGDVDIVLTQSGVDELIQWPVTMSVLCVDTYPAREEDDSYLAPTQNPDDIAYVIFTSGSTGTPKGVVIDHAGAVNTLHAVSRKFNVTTNDCVFGISALHFDLSVFDIFGTLAAGASLVIPKDEEAKDPEKWFHAMQRHNVSIWNSVPALMKMLVEYVSSESESLVDSLRLVMMSGDWIPVDLPEKIGSLAGENLAVISLGGATEVSIWSIYFPIEVVDPKWGSIPYGYPLENQQCYVLDDNLAPCPDLVPGDFYIGGVGLAKGYWKDDQKTASSFIVHPRSGERLYRTGDMARFLPEGYVEFIGRKDGQVKVQGHRIELGEIETNLNRDATVKESIVTVKKDSLGNNRLIAYVVLSKSDVSISDNQKEMEDAIERARFKFEQKGIRRFDANSRRVSLPDGSDSPLFFGVDFSVTIQAPIRDADLSCSHIARMLTPLRQARIGCGPLPKYAYPSAGSLYPVQSYLVLSDPIDGLDAGVYYYDPSRHQLVSVAESDSIDPDSTSRCSLYLVADSNAITPLYGNLSSLLCQLEAGYMGALLQQASALHGIRVLPGSVESLQYCKPLLRLSESHLALVKFDVGCEDDGNPSAFDKFFSRGVSSDAKTQNRPFTALSETNGVMPEKLSYFRRQSYRRFGGGRIGLADLSTLLDAIVRARVLSHRDASEVVDVYIYVKSGAAKDIGAGLYYFSPVLNGLEFISRFDMEGAYAGANQSVYEKSSFAIYFVTAKSICSDDIGDVAINFNIGQIGQVISMVAPEIEVGICAIGGFKEGVLLDGLGLENENYIVRHSFLGGKIAPAQSQTWVALDETQSQSTPSEKLKEALKHVLPDYMVPSKFVFVDEIPLSANGKLDRAALPDPDLEKLNVVVAPSNEMEEQLVSVWKSVLGRDTIGIHQSFFELGGSSLLVMKCQQRLKDLLGENLPVVELFKHSTIHELAEFLEGNGFSLAHPEHTIADPS